jgi:hypothetical protein
MSRTNHEEKDESLRHELPPLGDGAYRYHGGFTTASHACGEALRLVVQFESLGGSDLPAAGLPPKEMM